MIGDREQGGRLNPQHDSTININETTIRIDTEAVQKEQQRLQQALEATSLSQTGQFVDSDTGPLPAGLIASLNQRTGWQTGSYAVVPPLTRGQRLEVQAWSIELHPDEPYSDVIRLHVVGNAIIGRGPEAAIKLDKYDAKTHGISRKHAMLRPTAKRLFLADLGSTNGTLCNAVSVSKGVAHPLRHKDRLVLGDLDNVTLWIVGTP